MGLVTGKWALRYIQKTWLQISLNIRVDSSEASLSVCLSNIIILVATYQRTVYVLTRRHGHVKHNDRFSHDATIVYRVHVAALVR